MKEFIAWALTVWPILAALGGVAIIICGWVIRHDFGHSKTKTHTSQEAGREDVPTRREALESAKVAWGLWHTGTRMTIEKLIEMESLKRILILEPKIDNASIAVIANRSGFDKESIVNQIQDTTREALENSKDIRWYSQHRESAITIYDTTPIADKDGILKPCSEDAWMYVEYLTPKVGVDERKGEVIYNRGKGKSRFKGFYQEYEDIWTTKSVDPQNIPHID